MEWLMQKAIGKREYLNELYLEVKREDFREACLYL